MIKQCCVCGREFEAKRNYDIVCSDPDCRDARYKEVIARWKQEHYDKVLESNRNYMRRRREREKARKEAEAMARKEINADGYAERQKQKSLELAGKVSTTL